MIHTIKINIGLATSLWASIFHLSSFILTFLFRMFGGRKITTFLWFLGIKTAGFAVTVSHSWYANVTHITTNVMLMLPV